MFNNEEEMLYWTCPLCGANLDIDEKCDCRSCNDDYRLVEGGDIDED